MAFLHTLLLYYTANYYYMRTRSSAFLCHFCAIFLYFVCILSRLLCARELNPGASITWTLEHLGTAQSTNEIDALVSLQEC